MTPRQARALTSRMVRLAIGGDKDQRERLKLYLPGRPRAGWAPPHHDDFLPPAPLPQFPSIRTVAAQPPKRRYNGQRLPRSVL